MSKEEPTSIIIAFLRQKAKAWRMLISLRLVWDNLESEVVKERIGVMNYAWGIMGHLELDCAIVYPFPIASIFPPIK